MNLFGLFKKKKPVLQWRLIGWENALDVEMSVPAATPEEALAKVHSVYPNFQCERWMQV